MELGLLFAVVVAIAIGLAAKGTKEKHRLGSAGAAVSMANAARWVLANPSAEVAFEWALLKFYLVAIDGEVEGNAKVKAAVFVHAARCESGERRRVSQELLDHARQTVDADPGLKRQFEVSMLAALGLPPSQ